MSRRQNIDLSQLAQYIFVTNVEAKNEIFLDVQTIKTTKELFFFCFELFCKGLVILYGDGSRLCLNSVTMDQFHEIRRLFAFAHIKLCLNVYEKDVACLVDLIEEKETEREAISKSINALTKAPDNQELSKYMFNMLINNTLMIVSFDIL
jgi:hypothetical protein